MGAGLWLIASGYDIDIPKKYPAIYIHLLQYKDKAKKRDDQGKKWWNLRACSYYKDFEEEKIAWAEIVQTPSFIWDNGNFYFEATSFIMTGIDVNKYILALLNSSLIGFIFKVFYGTELSSIATRYKKTYIEQLPIIKLSKNEQKPFIDIVDKILEITETDDYSKNVEKQAQVREYKEQINQLVYKLYELTPEEIKIVERK